MNECHSLEVFSVQTTEVSLINLKSKCGHRKETREFNWRFWTVQNNAIIYDQCQCDTHLCNSSVQHLSSKVLVSCFFRTILSTDCFLALFLIQYLSNPQKHKQIANCTGALARPSDSLRLLVLTFKSQTCYSFWIFTVVLKWKYKITFKIKGKNIISYPDRENLLQI